MARNNDDMLMDDELAAAFLDDDGVSSSEAEVPAPAEIEEPSETAGEEEWEGDTDDFPGQLAVDVYETADKLIVKARTAGIKKNDLDVSISDNILTISGVLGDNEEEKTTRWHIQECYWGEFSRTIALPVQVHEDEVEAELKDGVLTIAFNKEKAAAPKKIQIN